MLVKLDFLLDWVARSRSWPSCVFPLDHGPSAGSLSHALSVLKVSRATSSVCAGVTSMFAIESFRLGGQKGGRWKVKNVLA